jgi:hypothetical protein
MLEGETLVAATEPWVLHEMARVATGDLKPITHISGFQEARAKEPSDATLIVVGTPAAAKLADLPPAKTPVGWSSGSWC